MQFVDRCVMLTIVVVLSSKYYYTALSLSLLCWKEKIFFRCSRFTHSTFLCSNTVFLHGCTSTHCVREAICRFNSMNHPTHLYIKLYHEMNIMNKYCHSSMHEATYQPGKYLLLLLLFLKLEFSF